MSRAIPDELAGLLAGCRASPDDDARRFVLADWLEEHGDADRAEFVRVQVRIAAWERDWVTLPSFDGSCDPDSPTWLESWSGEYARLRRRETELLGRHREGWLTAAVQGRSRLLHPPLFNPENIRFRRGMAEFWLHGSHRYPLSETLDWLADAASRDAFGWVSEVNLIASNNGYRHDQEDRDYHAVAAHPGLHYLTGLRLANLHPEHGNDLSPLADSPHLSGLRELYVGFGDEDAAWVDLEFLWRKHFLPSLTSLSIQGDFGRPEEMRPSVQALAACPHFPRLQR